MPLSFDTTPPFLVYSDAAFWLRKTAPDDICSAGRRARLAGGLGAVVYDPSDGSARYALGEPEWHRLLAFWSADHKTYIAQLEVLAAVSVYFTYPELCVGRRVNHVVECALGGPDPRSRVSLSHAFSRAASAAIPLPSPPWSTGTPASRTSLRW